MNWHWHVALLLLVGAALGILLAFPWFMLNLPSFAAAVAVFSSQLCHQNPERSFALAGFTLPICARCLALYLGGFAGIVIYPALSIREFQAVRIKSLFLLSLVLIGLDVGLDVIGLWKNTFTSRTLTGTFCGMTVGLLLSFAIQQLQVGFNRRSLGQPAGQRVHHSQ